MRSANLRLYAEKKRKEELIELQLSLTRLKMYRYKLPTAMEVQQAFREALWETPYEMSNAEHVDILAAAFTHIMDRIKTNKVNEYIKYSHG